MQLRKAAEPTRSEVSDLRSRMRAARGAAERDAVFFDVIQAYRWQPETELWQLLLDELGEALTARVNRFRTPSPFLRRKDLAQEMVLALHETALTLPLITDRYLERRLVLRTANRVSRLLKREWRHYQDQDPLEVLEPDEEEETDES